MSITKKSRKHKATFILFISATGLLLSYPFNFTFWGGLLSSLFCAAVVGGIADWFGITALFRKPLGIPFRTAIIPRNRERIFNSLVHMVEDELLTKEALKNKIREYRVSDTLLRYIYELGGKEGLETAAIKIVQGIIDCIQLDELADHLESLLKKTMPGIKISPFIKEAIDWTLENNCSEEIMQFLIDECIEVVTSSQAVAILTEMVSDILKKLREASSRERGGKKLAFSLLFGLLDLTNMPAAKIARKIQSNMLGYLIDMKNPKSMNRQKFNEWLQLRIQEFHENADLQESINRTLINLIEEVNVRSIMDKFVRPLQTGPDQSPDSVSKLQQSVKSIVEAALEAFKVNRKQQDKVDTFAKEFLSKLIDEKHGEIGRLASERLEMLTDDMLVELIESKAGNDLQMIRINGSIVGGFVGVIIFLFLNLV